MDNQNSGLSDAARIADPAQIPGSLLPNAGEGGPIFDGSDPAQTPAVPLPNPGEGGPAFPGVQPLPQTPSFVLPNAAVRFVSAARGYPALRVSIDGTRVATLLSAGEASCYSRIASGVRTVTVIGADGYIYLQRALNFRNGRAYIVVIAPRNGGLDLTQAEDTCF
ncbi:MAG: DUF4397 domain-containing protein [Clostridia bacterium]|nr:DUF4397 domain-containing protein [Clostridia bacterium]